MSILHTVNKSPFEKQSLSSCVAHALDGDAILMIEDAVYGAVSGTTTATLLVDNNNITIYALGPDLDARGLGEAKLAEGINIVDYDGFVDLAVEHDKTQSWL
jgi:tRNA 2-thiouridine synthesizing protein B